MEKNLKKMTEEELFDFIRNHREEFDSQIPDKEHEEKFLVKLGNAIKKAMVSIVPHLVKAVIITLVDWGVSFVLWRIFL